MTFLPAAWAIKRFHVAFNAASKELTRDVPGLLEYIDGQHEALKDPLESEAQQQYIEYCAIEIQRHIHDFTRSCMTEELKGAAMELAEQCGALCRHFDAFRQVETRKETL